MKTKNWLEHAQEAARRNRAIPDIGSKKTAPTFPLCLTCMREVDAIELKDVSNKGCDLWAKCHGMEDYYRVTWNFTPTDVSKDPLSDVNVGWAIQTAIRAFSPFNPHGHVEDHRKK